jgi:hypothetical protein
MFIVLFSELTLVIMKPEPSSDTVKPTKSTPAKTTTTPAANVSAPKPAPKKIPTKVKVTKPPAPKVIERDISPFNLKIINLIDTAPLFATSILVAFPTIILFALNGLATLFVVCAVLFFNVPDACKIILREIRALADGDEYE